MEGFLLLLQEDAQLRAVVLFAAGILLVLLAIFLLRTFRKPPHHTGKAQKTCRKRKQSASSGRERGEQGEAHVRHQLFFLDRKEYTSLFHLRLPYLGKTQEFDAVTVGKNGIFCMEVKAWQGDRLEVTREGQCIMHAGSRTFAKTCPLAQLQRHHQVLSTLLGRPVTDILVIDNDHVLIENKSSMKIVTTQMLNDFILRHKGSALSAAERQQICDELKRLTK